MFARMRITVDQAGDGALLLRSDDELGDYPAGGGFSPGAPLSSSCLTGPRSRPAW
jgi:hypothetical protein